jgi:Thioredoxin-like
MRKFFMAKLWPFTFHRVGVSSSSSSSCREGSCRFASFGNEPPPPSTIPGSQRSLALSFSHSLSLLEFLGPACTTFTPLLSVLHEEAQEVEKMFEVVYVSSDDSAQQCQDYMDKKHGDWLRIPFDSPLRNELKETFGVFAGKEQGRFPSTRRRSGIPTIVIVSRDGKEQAMLDCDSPVVVKEAESKGSAFVDQWEQFRW